MTIWTWELPNQSQFSAFEVLFPISDAASCFILAPWWFDGLMALSWAIKRGQKSNVNLSLTSSPHYTSILYPSNGLPSGGGLGLVFCLRKHHRHRVHQIKPTTRKTKQNEGGRWEYKDNRAFGCCCCVCVSFVCCCAHLITSSYLTGQPCIGCDTHTPTLHRCSMQHHSSSKRKQQHE